VTRGARKNTYPYKKSTTLGSVTRGKGVSRSRREKKKSARREGWVQVKMEKGTKYPERKTRKGRRHKRPYFSKRKKAPSRGEEEKLIKGQLSKKKQGK